jgi:hypothetical protein
MSLLVPFGVDPRTVQPVASPYTDWAIPANREEESRSDRGGCAVSGVGLGPLHC